MLWGVLLGGLWALYRDRRLLRIALWPAAATFLGDLATYLVFRPQVVLVSCLLAPLLFVTAANSSDARIDGNALFRSFG